ncbi:hypothetical protein [Leptospira idonii]|nr:hypothetical protein [Leptospira idonii]
MILSMSSEPKKTLFHRFLSFYFKILCILSVDLVVTNINAKVLALNDNYSTHIVTLLGMLVVLLLFWFLFSFIDKFTKIVLKLTVEVGNLVSFRKTAILLILSFLMLGVFYLYHYSWFGSWPNLTLASVFESIGQIRF